MSLHTILLEESRGYRLLRQDWSALVRQLQIRFSETMSPTVNTNWLGRLWQDESGFLGSTDYILMATIVVIGAICGLATMRDAVTQNLGDLADAMAAVDQSFTVNYTVSSGTVVSFGYSEQAMSSTLSDAAAQGLLVGQGPYCIDICGTPSGGESN